MGISISQQLISFFVSVLCGAMMGVFFDCFRSIRKIFRMSDFIVNICDGLFFIVSGFFAFFTILTVNNGELRWYLFVGILFGGLLYFLMLSNLVVKTFTLLLRIIIKIIYYLLKPFAVIINFIVKLIKKVSRILKKILVKIKIPIERLSNQFVYFRKTLMHKGQKKKMSRVKKSTEKQKKKMKKSKKR